MEVGNVPRCPKPWFPYLSSRWMPWDSEELSLWALRNASKRLHWRTWATRTSSYILVTCQLSMAHDAHGVARNLGTLAPAVHQGQLTAEPPWVVVKRC
jgi:hypothetical protein